MQVALVVEILVDVGLVAGVGKPKRPEHGHLGLEQLKNCELECSQRAVAFARQRAIAL